MRSFRETGHRLDAPGAREGENHPAGDAYRRLPTPSDGSELTRSPNNLNRRINQLPIAHHRASRRDKIRENENERIVRIILGMHGSARIIIGRRADAFVGFVFDRGSYTSLVRPSGSSDHSSVHPFGKGALDPLAPTRITHPLSLGPGPSPSPGPGPEYPSLSPFSLCISLPLVFVRPGLSFFRSFVLLQFLSFLGSLASIYRP